MSLNYFDLAVFTSQLSSLLRAGMGLSESLNAIEKDMPEPQFKAALKQVATDIEQGQAFHEAITQQHMLPQWYNRMLQAGEQSGKLPDLLLHLSHHAHFLERIRKKIGAALIYPALVLVVAASVGLYMSVFVFPIFNEMYAMMSTSLPTFTIVTLWLVRYLSIPVTVLVALAALGAVGMYYSLHRFHPRMEKVADWVVSRVPVLRQLFRDLAVVHFSRLLLLLLRSGVTLPEAVTWAAQGTQNTVFQAEAQAIAIHLEQGQSLGESLHKSVYFPPLLIWLLAVGEKNATLETSLAEAVQLYELEADTHFSYWGELLTPVLILLVGGLIGLVLIAFYWPMFSTINAIGAL